MKKLSLIFGFSIVFSCNKSQDITIFNKNIDVSADVSLVNKKENSIKTRFLPPKNYSLIQEKPNSFGDFLVNFPLENYGAKILDYTGNPIANQSSHEAVFSIDVGQKDLQQCADSIMRLYAEYLWKQNRKNEIAFHFTSGHLVKWSDYRDGIRPVIKGNSVSFSSTENRDDSYQNFRKYLDLIYNYAGTIVKSK